MNNLLIINRFFINSCVLVSTFFLLGWPLLAASQVEVMVSILPLKYFVEQIGGTHVTVQIMVGPGQSPATYEPTPQQMLALTQAKLYFAVGGLPFERAWGERIRAANAEMVWYNTSPLESLSPAPASFPQVRPKQVHTHEHGALDPHVWLSPPLAKQMAQRIAAALTQADPQAAIDYQAGLRAWQDRLDKLHTQINSIFIPLKQRTFMVFHPSWGHFAAAYDLTQIAIEINGKEPGPRTLAQVMEIGRKQRIPVVFVQTQFSRKTAVAVAAEIQAKVVDVDPLAEHYPDNLLATAHAFAAALQ